MLSSDRLPPHLMPTAETIGTNLIDRLASIPSYNPDLGLLITALCDRIGRSDSAAVWELWRLVQGLHYGRAFSAGNLERLKLHLNLLRPGWDHE